MIAQKIVNVGVYLKEDLHQRMQSGKVPATRVIGDWDESPLWVGSRR